MGNRDYLGECNEFKIALPDFEAQFCHRCFQSECSRSQFGKSKFDQRVMTWHERLFQNPPRMDSKDPRYLPIAGKAFKPIDVGPVPEIRASWVDPRDIPGEPQELAQDLPKEEPTPSVNKEIKEAKRAPSLMNTPNQSGRVLGTKPPLTGPASPPRDPWATPTETNSDPLVRPGTRIKLGSGV